MSWKRLSKPGKVVIRPGRGRLAKFATDIVWLRSTSSSSSSSSSNHHETTRILLLCSPSHQSGHICHHHRTVRHRHRRRDTLSRYPVEYASPSNPTCLLRSLTLIFQVVGAATPSFAPLLFAIFCYVAAAIQILGFLGVARVSGSPRPSCLTSSHTHRKNQSCIVDTSLFTQAHVSQCFPLLLSGLSFLPLVTPPPNPIASPLSFQLAGPMAARHQRARLSVIYLRGLTLV